MNTVFNPVSTTMVCSITLPHRAAAQLTFHREPRGAGRKSRYSFLPHYAASISSHRLPVGTPERCLLSCVVLWLYPHHLLTWPLACGAASLRWLIISCLSRDHLPRGPGSITAHQRPPIEPPPKPTGVSNHLANNDSCSCQSS
ncbi:hypothetical protein EYF80_026226 [Liparis tanakae]|uniref:Uncharacterized protein n=1 Tax=Liparis tanakae TaxID=230148 RepID=A0A4Z2HF80_9TELE|nr:hypothetical protein EYF80_026226 [Liparis tanakae]